MTILESFTGHRTSMWRRDSPKRQGGQRAQESGCPAPTHPRTHTVTEGITEWQEMMEPCDEDPCHDLTWPRTPPPKSPDPNVLTLQQDFLILNWLCLLFKSDRKLGLMTKSCFYSFSETSRIKKWPEETWGPPAETLAGTRPTGEGKF